MWKAKVNRHTTHFLLKTTTNPLGQVITNYIKRRPAVITAIAADTNPRYRVRHIGETYGSAGVGIAKHVTGARTNKYRPF